MIFTKRYLSFLLSFLVLSLPSYACHREDCQHSTTDTGIHWSRTLRFTYRDKEFNLGNNHLAMSKRAEIREREEGIDYLNLALGNIQFVYKEGNTFRTTVPFEIRALDSSRNSNPIFSNLRADQATQYSCVKFPTAKLNEGKYKTAEALVGSIDKIPLARYLEKKQKLNNLRTQIIESVDEAIQQIDSPKKKKRRTGAPRKQELYSNFKEALKKNKIHNAKNILQDIKTNHPFEQDVANDIKKYLQKFRRLNRVVKEDIQTHFQSRRFQVMANSLFGLDEWAQKMVDLEKCRSPYTHIKFIQNVLADCQHKLDEEEEALNANPLNFALRRLQAPKRDFSEETYLPFKRDQMLSALKGNIEDSHIHHSEQLLMHYMNTNFDTLAANLSQFLIRTHLGHNKLHGAFFNLFSTRDMCERCAVCLAIDHAHRDGIAAKIREFIRNHNNTEVPVDPFVVYTVSSRLPYTTVFGGERVNSREYVKGVDAYSNNERGRDVTSLSDAHISIQSYFFPHSEGEYTEDQINEYNRTPMEVTN